MVMTTGADVQFTVNENGLIFRQTSIDGSIQVIIPEVLHLTIFYNRHYSILTGRPGTRWMSDELL